jgi:RNA polymerase sigma-70 factor, ECF subfamily
MLRRAQTMGKPDQENLATPRNLTVLLREWSAGSTEARDQVFESVYGELRSLASLYLRDETRARQSIQPTLLVNEVYLRLVRQNSPWRDRLHFFGVAAQAMRRILVDQARRRSARKRSAPLEVAMSGDEAHPKGDAIDVIRLDRALARLASVDPRQGRIVELRFFAGLSIEETARVLDHSTATVKREWSTARAFLSRELREPEDRAGEP